MDVAIDHTAVGVEVEMLAARPRFGETHGALEITARCYLNQGDAGVLFVFGADAAIVGAALVWKRAVDARLASRLAELMAVIIGDVGADEVLERAVFGASFAEVDAARADNDLGLDQSPAVRAEAASRTQVSVIAHIHEDGP